MYPFGFSSALLFVFVVGLSVVVQESAAFSPSCTWQENDVLCSRISSRLYATQIPEPLATEGEWTAYLDEETTGLVYYFNSKSGESRWEPPTNSFPDVYLKPSKRRLAKEKRSEYQKAMKQTQSEESKGFFSFLRDEEEAKVEAKQEEKKEENETAVEKKQEQGGFFQSIFGESKNDGADTTTVSINSAAEKKEKKLELEEESTSAGFFDKLGSVSGGSLLGGLLSNVGEPSPLSINENQSPNDDQDSTLDPLTGNEEEELDINAKAQQAREIAAAKRSEANRIANAARQAEAKRKRAQRKADRARKIAEEKRAEIQEQLQAVIDAAKTGPALSPEEEEKVEEAKRALEALKAETAKRIAEAKKIEAEQKAEIGKKKEEARKARDEARAAAEAKRIEEKKLREIQAKKSAEENERKKEKRRIEQAKREEEARIQQAADKEKRKRLAVEQAERELEQARSAEQFRVAEQARLEKEAKLAERARVAEEARIAKEAQMAEKARVAEQARLAKEAELAEKARVADQARIAREAKLAELGRIAKADEARLAKEAKEKSMIDAQRARIAEEARLQLERSKNAAKRFSLEKNKLAQQLAEKARLARKADEEEKIDVIPEEQPIKVTLGSHVLPHPAKILWGGEDAVFTKGRTFGVFDGVSGATKTDGRPLYSKTLAQEFTRQAGNDGLSVREMISILSSASDAADRRATGASTACVASITDNGFLSAINLGDSCCYLIRDGRVSKKTTRISHYFDCPYQLSVDSPDRASDATKLNVELIRGDIVMMASDGIFDNLADKDILECVTENLSKMERLRNKNTVSKAIAKSLSDKARKVSQSFQPVTPYAKQAQKNRDPSYKDGVGGKVDDISCVVVMYE